MSHIFTVTDGTGESNSSVMQWTVRAVFRLAAALATLMVAVAEPPVVQNIQTILNLEPEDADRGMAVGMEATVTYIDHETRVCFVHDGRHAIFLSNLAAGPTTTQLHAGDRVRVTGVTHRGDYLPVIDSQGRIERLGPGALPVARAIRPEELLEPSIDAQWVEFDAVVKGFSLYRRSGVVELEVGGKPVTGMLPPQLGLTALPDAMLEQPVRVRAHAATQYNDLRQMCGRTLFLPSLDCILPLSSLGTLREAPLVTCDLLLSAHWDLGRRVRIRGIVTHVVAGSGLWIRGDGTGMFVQGAVPPDLTIGDTVEATGVASFAPFRPTLKAVRFQRIESGPDPDPMALQLDQGPEGRLHGELVTIEGEFLGPGPKGLPATMLCGTGNRTFEVVLPARVLQIGELERGTRLKLTGIYELTSTHPLVLARLAEGFRIQLRRPGDVAVLARPPWWNTRRVLWIVGGLLGLAALTIGWVVLLRRQVRKQASLIARQVVDQATLEERHRIARDLHDTLEQDLMGVSLLLDNASSKIAASPPAASGLLDLARRLLKRSREESRSTICDLRSVTLEHLGLPDAIREAAQPVAAAAGMGLAFHASGDWPRLPRSQEIALFRVAREAITNAARHSRGTTITVTLAAADGRITLCVEDDGCGFDPHVPIPPESRFGLRGIEERVNSVRGELEIWSSPGQGTRVRVHLPLETNTP